MMQKIENYSALKSSTRIENRSSELFFSQVTRFFARRLGGALLFSTIELVACRVSTE
jgi:hypothetical protein